MKKVFQFLLATLLLLSCSHKVIDVQSGGMLINQMNGYYSNIQLDSMCVSDTLPQIDKWGKLLLKEYETRDNITIYVYFKNNTTYKVEKINSDSVKIIKRIIK